MSTPFTDVIGENDQTRARHEHLESLRQLVGNVYPNKFERSRVVDSGREDTITAMAEKFRGFEPASVDGARPTPEAIEEANQQLNKIVVRLAGRIASPPRVMGKAAFLHLSDGVSRLQIYIRKADARAVNNDTRALIEEEGKGWELFELLDHGDFIGTEGYLFITKTGELSVHVESLQFLAKALRPLPDKMHGIHDPEIRQRQRYADLIAGSLKLERDKGELTPREVFERRSEIIREMRRFLEADGYVEVETPMLTPKATGAAARPFKTHHNALDIDLYARIAPELYLKRLLVGGFEKVYELNRNFRNEGIDRVHNPEFTMLEFYWAYADVNQMMDFCEEMLRTTVFKVLGHTHVQYRGRRVDYVAMREGKPTFVDHEVEESIDFASRFDRLTMKEAIIKYWPREFEILDGARFDPSWLDTLPKLQALTKLSTQRLGDRLLANTVWNQEFINQQWRSYLEGAQLARRLRSEEEGDELVRNIGALFGNEVETQLTKPTFITNFPKAISPLSKASPTDPAIAERFELFIAGMECANGFSELNDPREQYDRFNDQMTQRERGDEEAMVMDEDYIRALSYGMPPAAGIGIGIDRFVMLLTNQASIRDVILFPHMRPARKVEATGEATEEEA